METLALDAIIAIRKGWKIGIVYFLHPEHSKRFSSPSNLSNITLAFISALHFGQPIYIPPDLRKRLMMRCAILAPQFTPFWLYVKQIIQMTIKNFPGHRRLTRP